MGLILDACVWQEEESNLLISKVVADGKAYRGRCY
jgi:hypothetical protein